MVLLWNGESLRFLEAVCAGLDRAGIAVATPRVEVLLKDAADRYHLKHLKTFPYVLGVFKSDFPEARKILELVARKNFPTLFLPLAAFYLEPFDESSVVARSAKPGTMLDATTTIYSSEDLRAIEFVEASLDASDIPFRRVCLENGTYEIRVRSENEISAGELVGEIARGTSSQLVALQFEDENLRDDGPESYFLAWFLPGIYIFVLLAFNVAGSLAEANGQSDFFVLALLGGGASLVGMVWMVNQAIRYEVRPFRYCAAALLPFTCVWYYFERYRVREGLQRLPVSVRARLQNPPA